MSGGGGAKDASAQQNRSTLLARIASTLGCSVEALRDGAVPDGPLGQAVELLQLWSAIEDPQDRRRVLDLARKLAGSRAES